MASVKVAVRVRPINRREQELDAKFIISMEKNQTKITNLKIPEGGTGDLGRERTKIFTYDFSYFSVDPERPNYASQEMVFNNLGIDVLQSAFEGYNACIFAYGQTGSGKSYTMMGNAGDTGLIPRICEGLFNRVNEKTRWNEASFRTEVSYLEIYNERVRDLLRRKSSETNNLRIREHPKEGPYVEDLSKHLVQNYSDVEELMEGGNINRTTAATGMNDVSSRSHAIFTINFTQAKFDTEMPCETVSKIHLVDLAGSERADATGATGVRLKEGGNINKSLVTLGNVISALADISQDVSNPPLKKKQVFVPYRDSVLTWLLKDSLGGNSKTIMIATISPADVNYGETLSTLRYANRAKNIINKPTINEDPNVKLIRELRAEIARLKTLLAQGNQIALLDSPTALSMEEKLQQNEARVQELTKEWTNKWNETQNILKEQTLALRKEGIGVVLDSELPHLIGIDDDLLSTGIILYHLKEGQTHVGREDAAREQDIVLHGLDLESEHCIFEHFNGTVHLIPLVGAQCSINGIQITEATQLNQGAVILLGRTNMFRFNHPKEAAKLREKRKSGLLSSFSLSMSDLSKSCESLSTVMLYNPGLEFERQQREELEKLESKRKLIEEMEEKQKTNKAELERMQQEVESQRKETEIVQLEIRKQEENLKKKSFHIENRMKDLLAEKEKFEEERLREQQEIELQKKKQEEEILGSVKEELQRLQELNQNEKVEKMQIFHELEKLKKEKEEQYLKLEVEKKRLEAQEREQALLVANLEEQLRDKQIMIQLLKRGDLQRVEEEKKNLEDIRESLLRVKEARSEAEEDCEELEKVQCNFMDFKRKQLEQLTSLERDLVQERNHLEIQRTEEQENLDHLKQVHTEHLNCDKNAPDTALTVEECNKIRSCEYRLHHKERQLLYLINNHLPTLLEEKQRASEVLDRGLQSLDNTLYEVEKEMEEKEEQLAQYRASASELQQLQETFEFTANVARQEEKVWKKEKEILESRQKQQREALEQAVAKLERRHSALQRHSTLEIEEQKQKLATLNNSCREQTGLQATVEAQQKALEQERENLDLQIQQLKQKIYEGDRVEKGYPGAVEERLTHNSVPSNIAKSQAHFMPLVDDRINTFIEEEVQRRLQNIQYSSGENNISLLQSTESTRDNEKFHNGAVQRKLKYEKREPWLSFHGFLTLSNDDSKYNQAGEDTRVSRISRQDKAIGTFSPFSRTIQDLGMTQENTNREKEIEQEYVSWRYPDGCDWNQPKDIKSKKTDSPTKSVSDRSGMFDLFGKKSTFLHSRNKSLLVNHWEHKNIETEFDSFSYHHMPTSEPIFSSEVQPGASHFWSLQKDCNRISQINQQTSDQTLDEKATNEIKTQLPESFIGSKQNYGLGRLFNLFCNSYRGFICQEFRNGWFSKWIKDLVSVHHKNEKCTRLTSFIKNCPVIKDVQLNLSLGLKVNSASLGPGRPLEKEGTMNYLSSQISIDMHTVNHAAESSNLCRNDTLMSSLVLRQKFVDFSEDLLKLQEYSLEELLQYLTSALPEICAKTNELKKIYWIAVGNHKKSGPEPACLLLYDSVLYAIIPSTNQLESNQNSLDIFHVFSISTLKEIQIGYAGQSITLLGPHVGNELKLFTFNKYFTQRICHDILSNMISPLDHACLNHPLLNDDLLKLSVDWSSAVTNLVLENSVCLSCNFESDSADLLYVLHENMDINKPFLGDIQIVLYTTVKLAGDIRSLVLTNTHIGLIKENGAFCLISRVLHCIDSQSQCAQIQLHSLSELRCVIIPDKENLRKIELAFSKASKLGSSSSLLGPSQGEKNAQLESASSFRHNQPSSQPYIWRLIFSSDEDAGRLMLHLTGQLNLNSL
ncbi:kinesin-like protein KIF16B isoform X2 [Protobothrops mucrosquamatus]|uniref:kinesin-like protein KIF16B isoform X2 n=1 Tax=Protobothrops mucrosquamatus TaxID=103944 RepID=UPI000775D9AE|nr:kinesin-like protein KIF16B isoform X2 [Protobothrops mucrosquamatus]